MATLNIQHIETRPPKGKLEKVIQVSKDIIRFEYKENSDLYNLDFPELGAVENSVPRKFQPIRLTQASFSLDSINGSFIQDGTVATEKLKDYIAATKIGNGVVDNTEFSYLNGVTSSIQTQLDGKVDLAGDAMTGYLYLYDTPTENFHAATKEYVDMSSASVTLQAAYDASDGTIVTTTSKPIDISGLSGVKIKTTAQVDLAIGDGILNSGYYTKRPLDVALIVTPSGTQNFAAQSTYLTVDSATTSTGFLAALDTGWVNNLPAGQTVSQLYGLNMAGYNYNSGTLTAAYGGIFAVYNDQFASGVTTNAYAGYFLAQRYGGTVTNQYGIYVDSVTGATNNYAIFTNAGLIEFNDQLFIDGRADRNQLIVQAHSTQTTSLAVFENSAGTDQITFSGTGGAVFNEAGNAVDFRVESDTNANMLFVKGSTNQVGIGKNPSLGIALEIDNTTGSGVLYMEGSDNTFAYMRAGGVGFAIAYRLQKSTGDTIFEFGTSSSTNLGYVNSVTGAFYLASNNIEALRIDTSQNIGIGTSTPLSKTDIVGSFGANITSVSVNTTLNATHRTLIVNATSANITVTLPAAATCTRREYIILKSDSSANTVTIDGNASETINGSLTQTISSQYDFIKVQSDGSNWYIIG